MTGSVWIVSYVLLWVTVVLLGFSVVALLRQIGVLHTRVAPMGVHFAGEGPELDQPAPALDGVGYQTEGVTLLAFTSPTCEICAGLEPGLRRLSSSYDEVTLRLVDHAAAAAVFETFRVRSTPYLVAVDGDGIVRSRGVANSLDQAEEMLAEVLAGPPIELGTVEPDSAPDETDADGTAIAGSRFDTDADADAVPGSRFDADADADGTAIAGNRFDADGDVVVLP